MTRFDRVVPRRSRWALPLVALAIFALAVAAGCGGGDDETSTTADGGEAFKIAVIQPGPHPYIEAQNEAFEASAGELGVDLHLSDANWDAAADVAAVQNAVTEGNEAIVVHAVESEALAPAVDNANDAGVCTVGVTANVGPDQESVYPGMKGFIGWKDMVGGELAGEALAAAMGGKGNVVIMIGVEASTSEQARVAGAEAVWEENYPQIKVLAVEPDNFEAAKARSVMQNLLQRYGDEIEGAFITTNFEAVAAADVIAASPQKGTIPIVSNGGWSKYIDYISDDRTTAVIPFAPQDEAKKALELAIECIEGDTEPVYVEETELPAVQPLEGSNYTITKDNVEEFEPQW